MAKDTFRRGGLGVFNCRVCERRTRNTDETVGCYDICPQCFELAGIENSISDSGDKANEVAKYRNEIVLHLQRLEKKKVDTRVVWADLIAEVVKYSVVLS